MNHGHDDLVDLLRTDQDHVLPTNIAGRVAALLLITAFTGAAVILGVGAGVGFCLLVLGVHL